MCRFGSPDRSGGLELSVRLVQDLRGQLGLILGDIQGKGSSLSSHEIRNVIAQAKAQAREAFRLAGHKLPVRVKFIKKEEF